jgi:hypothetical protein
MVIYLAHRREVEMPRPRTITPILKPRGKKGNYYFRRQINKKDTEISTGTNILSEAEDFRKRYMESEISAHVEQLQKGNAKRRGKDYPSYHKT